MVRKKTLSPLAKMVDDIKTSPKKKTGVKKTTRGRKPKVTEVEVPEETNKLYVKVKYEQKNQFKTYFPEAMWKKGKGWEIDDNFENASKLDEWNEKSAELEKQELQQALKQITEGLSTIVRKVEELDILIQQKGKK